MSRSFPLSEKYKDFIRSTGACVEFLEGTTASGKTTVGAGVKFMLMVSKSTKKLHVIASKTTGQAEKNIIQQDNGILDIHRSAVYCGNGDRDYKIPHLKFEDKIIFILGYDNKDKWKQALGSQFGCVYIDEINTADIDFVREICTRNDYLLGTLNPDTPTLPIYDEFINHARPYQKYAFDVPKSIMTELERCEPKKNWRYWFFTFRDNLALSQEDIQKKMDAAPVGTKLYKNKILGLRGKATGLVFPNFSRIRHTIEKFKLKELINNKTLEFKNFVCGVDTAYSSQSEDTLAFIYLGLTRDGQVIVLDEWVCNNKDKENPLAPSDTVLELLEFMNRNRGEWGTARHCFVDSADQATITELKKYKRKHPLTYEFIAAYKNVQIIDRINIQLGWFHKDKYLVLKHCKNHIRELECYSWDADKDNTPEDCNDHTINASQYAWIPYRFDIGLENI